MQSEAVQIFIVFFLEINLRICTLPDPPPRYILRHQSLVVGTVGRENVQTGQNWIRKIIETTIEWRKAVQILVVFL